MKKRLIKILSLVLIIILVFEIYTYGKSNKLYYVSIGDSLTAGVNSYGKIENGYTWYIKDYLIKNKRLAYYKNYAQSGYETRDIIKDLNNNLELKKDLRESDLVTMTIGANDLIHKLNLKNIGEINLTQLKKQIELIIPNIDKCLLQIRKYAKERIIIIGYYNPLPFLFNKNSKDLDSLFAYIDEEYRKLANKYNCEYISLYESFKTNSKYLPNPSDIHPSSKGYEYIANKIIKETKM